MRAAFIKAEEERDVWDSAWGQLRAWAAKLARRRAWENVVAEAVLHGQEHEAPESALVSMKLLVERPEGDVQMSSATGETWQYMGTFYGGHKDAMTGVNGEGWYHQFRHRECPLDSGRKVVADFRADKLPRSAEPVVRKLADDGKPF